jgi:uncharacterized protein YigE (DUF2233 family)
VSQDRRKTVFLIENKMRFLSLVLFFICGLPFFAIAQSPCQTEAHAQFDITCHFDPQTKTVRQTWKMSRDAGKTWQLLFDGIYRKE